MSMKNSNNTIGNRTRDLLACRAVPQPTALPRAPHIRIITDRYVRYLVQMYQKKKLFSQYDIDNKQIVIKLHWVFRKAANDFRFASNMSRTLTQLMYNFVEYQGINHLPHSHF
jgi:hypothetical protein